MNPTTLADRAKWNALHMETAPDNIKFGALFGKIKEAQAQLSKLYAFPGLWHELAEQMEIIQNAAAEARACAQREAERAQGA